MSDDVWESGEWELQYDELVERAEQAEALAADRLELAKVVDRHRKDRMHSDMKLAWEMAKEILAQAKEDRDE